MGERFSLQELVSLLIEKHGMSRKDAEAFVKEFFSLIEEALESDRYVKIKGFGTFKLIDVESRESVNVNTGERFQIPEYTKVSFTPDPALRDAINKPFAHFETVLLHEHTVLEESSFDEPEETAESLSEPNPPRQEVCTAIAQPEDRPIEPTAEPEPPLLAATPFEDPDQTGNTVTPLSEEIPAEEEPVAIAPLPTETQQGQPTPIKRKKTTTYLLISILLILLLCGGAVLYIYYPDLYPQATESLTPPASSVEEPPVNYPLSDTIVVERDTVAEAIPEAEPTVVEPVEPVADPIDEKKRTAAKPTTPVKPDSLSYEIVGFKTTHVVTNGETLTRVSLRYYGTKALWPYIVKYNQGVIKNPDCVPAGTRLRIPELVKK